MPPLCNQSLVSTSCPRQPPHCFLSLQFSSPSSRMSFKWSHAVGTETTLIWDSPSCGADPVSGFLCWGAFHRRSTSSCLPSPVDGRLDYFQFGTINPFLLKLQRGRTLRLFPNVSCCLRNNSAMSSHAICMVISARGMSWHLKYDRNLKKKGYSLIPSGHPEDQTWQASCSKSPCESVSMQRPEPSSAFTHLSPGLCTKQGGHCTRTPPVYPLRVFKTS